MASMQATKSGNSAVDIECEPDWEKEMQVTFDSAELASFFEGFDPLDGCLDSGSGDSDSQ